MSRWANGRGPYIRMHSGRKFYLTAPKPEDFHVDDIAYHLAGINRYTGGGRISVAQHMVVGARLAERFYPDEPLLPARFMIHDIAEHALGDISSPLKSLLPDYKALEAEADLAVEERFGLTFVGDPLVKEVDDRMWLTERLDVYRDVKDDISEDTQFVTVEPFNLHWSEYSRLFRPWAPEDAEAYWLTEFRKRLPWVEIW